MTTPIERAAEVLTADTHAPMTEHWPDGSCRSCPWPLHESESPEGIARAVFESIDRESLIDVLTEATGWEWEQHPDEPLIPPAREMVGEVADAILAHLLEGGK